MSRFARAPRFDDKIAKKQNKDVGPGSYNSNPFLNIEANVNASHHVYGYPIMGLPAKNKDEGWTMVNGAKVFHEAYSTLRYRKQLARTAKETSNLKSSQDQKPMRQSATTRVGNPALNFVLNRLQ